MFGKHSIPMNLVTDSFSLHIEKVDDFFVYSRKSVDDESKTVLLNDPEEIIINPVEPVNKPSGISSYLQLAFSDAILISPRHTSTVFLQFPVEIGVFIPRKENHDLLDVISLGKKKYSLYGTPRGGYICRYWKSEVFSKIPDCDPSSIGVLELDIGNRTDRWIKINKVVFDVYGMKIFFNKNLVGSKAQMEVVSEGIAETGFVNSPIVKGMKRAIEIYRLSKLAVTSADFHMGEGI